MNEDRLIKGLVVGEMEYTSKKQDHHRIGHAAAIYKLVLIGPVYTELEGKQKRRMTVNCSTCSQHQCVQILIEKKRWRRIIHQQQTKIESFVIFLNILFCDFSCLLSLV